MKKRIKKKLAKRGGYKKYKNWNSWTKMKAWAAIIAKIRHNNIFDDILYKTPCEPSYKMETLKTGLPSIYWRNYNEQTPTQKTS